MAWGRREEGGTKESLGEGLSIPSHATQQCRSLAWEGIPEGQAGNGDSEKVK